jgi:hypothetical protein
MNATATDFKSDVQLIAETVKPGDAVQLVIWTRAARRYVPTGGRVEWVSGRRLGLVGHETRYYTKDINRIAGHLASCAIGRATAKTCERYCR